MLISLSFLYTGLSLMSILTAEMKIKIGNIVFIMNSSPANTFVIYKTIIEHNNRTLLFALQNCKLADESMEPIATQSRATGKLCFISGLIYSVNN